MACLVIIDYLIDLFNSHQNPVMKDGLVVFF